MADPTDRVLILIVAFGIEAVLAYPAPLFRAIGHPVSWIGALIKALDSSAEPAGLFRRNAAHCRRRDRAAAARRQPRRRAGAGNRRARCVPYLGFVLAVVAVAMLIAAGNLDQHVRAVAAALRTGGLDGGRQSIAKIVGRDPDALDEAAICRAAIESLAENASDGVTAPALWYLVGGLPGMIGYKAINTADSMIGHLSERYRAFGWAAARLDDLVNLPASRLTGLMFIAAAAVVPGASASSAWQAFRRDARLASLAQCRLAGSGDGRRARAAAGGTAHAMMACSSTTTGWATVAPRRPREDIDRALTIYRTAFVGALLILAAMAWLTTISPTDADD